MPFGTLYVVGTPIGNLGDLSPRALEVLDSVDFIAAEDTRVTLKLLNHFGLKKPMVSYYEHNRLQRGEIIVNRLLQGESCALVTDAGMPAISDPGEELVRQCREAGIPLFAVPGPSAVITALALSGLPTGRFTFEGFLSMNRKNRLEHLRELETEKRTMVFYEAPHKLPATLRDLLEHLGNRKLALARELTKLHEEVLITSLADAVSHYENQSPRGEFVLVIEGMQQKEPVPCTLEEAVAMARQRVEKGDSPSLAAKAAARETGIKKGSIYRLLTAEQPV